MASQHPRETAGSGLRPQFRPPFLAPMSTPRLKQTKLIPSTATGLSYSAPRTPRTAFPSSPMTARFPLMRHPGPRGIHQHGVHQTYGKRRYNVGESSRTPLKEFTNLSRTDRFHPYKRTVVEANPREAQGSGPCEYWPGESEASYPPYSETMTATFSGNSRSRPMAMDHLQERYHRAVSLSNFNMYSPRMPHPPTPFTHRLEEMEVGGMYEGDENGPSFLEGYNAEDAWGNGQLYLPAQYSTLSIRSPAPPTPSLNPLRRFQERNKPSTPWTSRPSPAYADFVTGEKRPTTSVPGTAPSWDGGSHLEKEEEVAPAPSAPPRSLQGRQTRVYSVFPRDYPLAYEAKIKADFMMIIEIFGHVASLQNGAATQKSKVTFVLRGSDALATHENSPPLHCVYYPIDRALPNTVRNGVHVRVMALPLSEHEVQVVDIRPWAKDGAAAQLFAKLVRKTRHALQNLK